MSKHIDDLTGKTVLISRTDSIGDVVLTLPVCAWIKQQYPTAKIIFLGETYTRPVLECMPEIDEIIEWSVLEQMPASNRVEELRSRKIDVCIHIFPRKEIATLARKARIPLRIGTSHRSFHLLTCNLKLSFSRKNSDYHESQLNFELLKPFGIVQLPSMEEVTSLLKSFRVPEGTFPEFLQQRVQPKTKKVILHPGSRGSAVEWPLDKYARTAQALLEKGYQVFFTGSEKEGIYFRSFVPAHPNCIDTSGKLTLHELIYFISKCDALVACSTGPLHLAGILGLRTVGLYSPKRPIHPGRWQPIGKDIHILVDADSKQKEVNYIQQIEVSRVIEVVG